MSRRVFRTTGIRLGLVILALAGFTQSMSLLLRVVADVEAHGAVHQIAQHKAYTQPSDTQRNTDKTYVEEPRKQMAPATGALEDGVQQTDSDRKLPKVYLPEPGRGSASPQEAALPDLTIPLASGVPVNGTIGAASFGSCGLGGTQYTIAVPFGATQLRIDLSGNGAQDIDLFARFDVPIEILGGQLITDHASTSLSGFESITITPTSSPTLRQGTYFIGIGNCSPAIASFTLTATLSGGGFQAIPLISGVPVNGSLPAPNPGSCVLSATQYTITVPAGATQLRIDLNGNQNVDLFARLGLPVDIQGGQVVADHASATASSVESITITPLSSPSLQQGTYFIGLGNCSSVAASFTLTANVSSGGGSQVTPLTSGVPVNGTIPASPPDACILGGTQYTILVPANAMHLRIDLSGNQDVDLFARFGQSVEVQGGQAVADHSARTVFTVESIEITPSSSPPLRQGTYFIAVANCGQAIANLTITAAVSAGAPPSTPNLIPFQPAGWSDKIVVSTVTGTHSDTGALRVTDPLFVDWAVRNSGTAATSARFFVKLFVDGAERGSWFADPPLNSGAHAFVEDFSIGSLAAGAHSLRITVDVQNNISETNEADNEYTKSITVSAQTCSTLTINIAPNDGGTVSSSSQATCQAPSSLAEQLAAASSSDSQTPGAVSVSPSSPDNTAGHAFAELITKAEKDGSVRVIVGLQSPSNLREPWMVRTQ